MASRTKVDRRELRDALKQLATAEKQFGACRVVVTVTGDAVRFEMPRVKHTIPARGASLGRISISVTPLVKLRTMLPRSKDIEIGIEGGQLKIGKFSVRGFEPKEPAGARTAGSTRKDVPVPDSPIDATLVLRVAALLKATPAEIEAAGQTEKTRRARKEVQTTVGRVYELLARFGVTEVEIIRLLTKAVLRTEGKLR